MDNKEHLRILNLCDSCKQESECLSRKVYCVLCDKNQILGGGCNSPPMDDLQCVTNCRRSGFKSGERLDLCNSIHAEVSVILDSRIEKSVVDDIYTLYSSDCVPCKNCMLFISMYRNIETIVCGVPGFYDEGSKIVLRAWLNVDTRHKLYYRTSNTNSGGYEIRELKIGDF